MSHLVPLSGNTLVKALEKTGYRVVRQRGSHMRLECKGKRPVTVPNYPVIGKGLVRKILRDAELSIEEFQKLL